MEDRRNSLTWYLVKGGRPLMGTLPELCAQVPGTIADFGPDCVDWLGVPLKAHDRTIGVLVAQSYTPGLRFGEARGRCGSGIDQRFHTR